MAMIISPDMVHMITRREKLIGIADNSSDQISKLFQDLSTSVEL